MELYTALRNIISVDGQDIIKDVRVINILNDYNISLVSTKKS